MDDEVIYYLIYINQEKLKGKLTEDQKQKLLDAIEESRKWLDKNPEADKEEYEEELRELEKYKKITTII